MNGNKDLDFYTTARQELVRVPCCEKTDSCYGTTEIEPTDEMGIESLDDIEEVDFNDWAGMTRP